MGGTGRSLPLLLLFVVVLLQQHMRTTTALGRFTSNIINRYCIESERRALLTFKHSLVDDDDLLSSWGTELEAKRDCCRWWGIQCSNQTGHVIMLNLRSTYGNGIGYERLRGNISLSLLELQHLTHLDLSYNDFGGSRIPEFIGSLTKLGYLGLSRANFSGTLPYQLGNLSSLHSLDLSYNFDTNAGNLEWLSHLSSLKHLNLSGVDLSKANHWMQAIKMLPSLTELRLRGCNLFEPLPPPLSSPPFINSSASLAVLDLSFNNLTSSMFHWLFNLNLSSLVDLGLSFNQLQGPIPDAFGNIVSLENLDLQYNQLEGGIPKYFGNMCNLRTLILYRNNFTGQLSEFVQNFSSGCLKDTLEYLDLGLNQIWGSLPDLIVFSSLRMLYLDSNQLNGTVHEGIGNLSKLEVLYVSYNSLVGVVPESIGYLSKLERLVVSSNSLEGVISEAHLLNLSKLQYLDFSFNSLALNLSSYWVPPFQLDTIILRSCKIGPRFPEWLQTQNNFSFLDISNSGISDAIPNWFWKLPSRLKLLNISQNQIHGIVPDLSMKFVDFPRIDLSSNYFEGPIPLFLSNVTSLNLSKNMFSGPVSFLCAITGGILSYLDLSNNLLSGELPHCWMQFKNLAILNLANNNLFGKIPSSMGFLRQLLTLHLRNNSFFGELPSSLKNCKDLSVVDFGDNRFSGKIPAWIGENLSKLVVLRLRSNRLNGSMPLQLCHLSRIQILDISLNNISGTIPKCLNNFIAMAQKVNLSTTITHLYFNRLSGFSSQYDDSALVVWKGREFEYGRTLGLVKIIDISSNKLTGGIPQEITSLVELVALNLSRNNLTGLINPKIGQLKLLQSLDLSRNWLFGEIPGSFSDLNFLSYLDLSFNDLSGKIPTGTQLQSLNASAYIGNGKLCGAPLPNKCSEDEITQDPQIVAGNGDTEFHGHEDGFITLGFYVSMGLGFILGFWGVCGTLLFNSSWRYAYFQFLKNMRDRFYETAGVNLGRLQRRLQI